MLALGKANLPVGKLIGAMAVGGLFGAGTDIAHQATEAADKHQSFHLDVTRTLTATAEGAANAPGVVAAPALLIPATAGGAHAAVSEFKQGQNWSGGLDAALTVLPWMSKTVRGEVGESVKSIGEKLPEPVQNAGRAIADNAKSAGNAIGEGLGKAGEKIADSSKAFGKEANKPQTSVTMNSGLNPSALADAVKPAVEGIKAGYKEFFKSGEEGAGEKPSSTAAKEPVEFDKIQPDKNTGLKTIEMPDKTELADQSRLNSPDAQTSKPRPGQSDAAAGLEESFGKMRPATKVEKGDFIISDGPNKGKSVDFMFTTDSSKAGQLQNKNFDKNWSGTQKQILDHVKKYDIVPMDLRGLDSNAKAKVLDFVQQLPPESKVKVVVLQ